MIPNVSRFAFRGASALASGALVTLLACTSSSPSKDAGPSASSCAAPGGPVAGPQDTHCAGMMQPTDMSVCYADVMAPDSGASGDDGGTVDAGAFGNCGDPAYGPTMDNTSGSDDDCKYDVSWTSTPVCEGAPGVYFTVTAKKRVDGTPVTGANTRPDVVLDCDHPIPNLPPDSPELSPGTYLVGPVIFDKPGRWVLRFHFYETCEDNLPTSPHGHAAFWIQVP
jgi:hypothetical protein